MTRAGRTTLVKVTLSAIPIHTSIAVKISPATFKAIDQLRRIFVWTSTNTVAALILIVCGRRCHPTPRTLLFLMHQ
jgi:hypothetical protein